MSNSEESAIVDGECARFFAASRTALAVVGFDGTLRRVNAAWVSLLGSAGPGESLLARMVPGDRAALASAMLAVREQGAVDVPLRVTREDGSTLSLGCELTAEPGAACFYCAAHGRIEPRPHDDEQERFMEALMRCLATNEVVGLYMVDERSGRVVFANAAVGQTWEMENLPERARAGTLMHEEILRYVDTRTLGDPVSLQVQRALEATSGSGGHEIEAELRSGRSVRWLVLPVEGEDGRTLARLYLSKDVTERKRVEQSMKLALERQKRSEAEFRRLLEHVPDGIVVMREGKFAYANPAAARILGYDSAEELIGMHFAAIVRPEELSQSDERVRLMGGAAPPPRSLRPMVRRDGSTVYAETLGFQTELDGAPATLVIAHDVTEERRLETQMRQAERLASLGTLSATIAHEINNPLTYILLNLQVTRRSLDQLAKESPSPALANALRLIDQSLEGTERVRVIVRDLRGFSRAEDDGTLVDVRAVLDSVIPMAEHELRQRATVVRDYSEVSAVRANGARLGQVFLNLLVNAAQAIPKGGAGHEIRVGVSAAPGDKVRVTVRDTGEGMSREVRERVFEPFFTTKPAGVGTGLGLSLCLRIVHALGGEITVDSELGKGSTFALTLPMAPRGTERGAAPPEPVVLPRVRILIVDDEPRIAERLAELLQMHEVVVVSNGRDALSRLREQPFEVIFCDLMMPDLKGTDVFEEASREHPALAGRFIFMTAGAFTPSARALLDRVANPRLDKPFTEAQVQEVLGLVIARAQRD